VRNPLCSAITALSFVSAATKEPDNDPEAQKRLHEDISIIDASLSFIDELLRNTLDMHKAADKQMKITKAPTDLLCDVLEPVGAILHLRGSKVKVSLDCPKDLVCFSDRMRLKQICLNLSINAVKFVTTGYIRLAAKVVDGTVKIYVEDTGPGIPLEKRDNLFAKFQESLDLLNQGTGMGLCLCKHLAELLGGDIYLDESFNSGIPGFPGSRFVLDLGTGPMTGDELRRSTKMNDSMRAPVPAPRQGATPKEDASSDEETALLSSTDTSNNEETKESTNQQLPEEMNVLYVDDDMIIRRLFVRALQRVAPKWKVDQASNGETG